MASTKYCMRKQYTGNVQAERAWLFIVNFELFLVIVVCSSLLRRMLQEGRRKGLSAEIELQPRAQSNCDDFNKMLCRRGACV